MLEQLLTVTADKLKNEINIYVSICCPGDMTTEEFTQLIELCLLLTQGNPNNITVVLYPATDALYRAQGIEAKIVQQRVQSGEIAHIPHHCSQVF